MIIEYIKDCKHPNRDIDIPKGKRLRVSGEFGRAEIKAKKAIDVSEKENEFMKAIFQKNNIEDNGDN